MTDAMKGQVASSAANVTAFFVPSAKDLFMVVPRLLRRAGSFALYYLPDQLDNIGGKATDSSSATIVATAIETMNTTAITSSLSFAQATPTPLSASNATVRSFLSFTGSAFSFQNVRNMGGIFSYLTSKWALATFAAAIVLNRTHFYASSRVPLNLRWHVQLALRLGPIVVFVYQIQLLLQAMRCQTSPEFSILRYGDPGKQLAIDFAGEGGFMYRLSSFLLYWQDDASCCSAAGMSPSPDNPIELAGSLSLLWPLFVCLCGSQFVETIASALQGRQTMPETGMTIFEHSLAFAEAEAMISNALGFGFFGLPKAPTSSNGTVTDSESSQKTVLMTRSMLLQRLNVPPEVVLISLISSFSHLSSHVLAVAGIRAKCRLANTGIWALCYMAVFVWTFFRLVKDPTGNAVELGIMRLPTVCIVGFIPHVLVLFGICVCAMIYGLALLLTVFSPPPVETSRSLKERFSAAYRNLQANVQFSATTPIKLDWNEDFYTTLLKVGFTVLTAASEAVYLNEGTRVRVSKRTWLEEKRIDEYASKRGLLQRSLDSIPIELRGDYIAGGIGAVDEVNLDNPHRSGYARERRTQTTGNHSDGTGAAITENGVGLMQRRGRWRMSYEYIKGASSLIAGLLAQGVIKLLRKLGINYNAAWLLRAAAADQQPQKEVVHPIDRQPGIREFWILADDGTLVLPKDTDVDVELETWRRMKAAPGVDISEDALNENLYRWWRFGGWWGERDSSGEYQAREQEDDTTSMISMATDATDWSDAQNDGRRTPTQEHPYPGRREMSPPESEPLDTTHLALLLDPITSEQQQEARILSRHLQTDQVMTRSRYKKIVDREHNKVLTSSRAFGKENGQEMTSEEEETALEHFIIDRRSAAGSERSGASWDTGAEGMGASGPQCVVCQVIPRTVMRLDNATPPHKFLLLSYKTKAATPQRTPRIPRLTHRYRLGQTSLLLSHSFMPSEPTEVIQHASPTATPVDHFLSAQHGRSGHDSLATPYELGDGRADGRRDSGDSHASAVSPQSSAVDAAGQATRLSPPKTPSPTPRNRIADYENALSVLPRKTAEGPVFEVVKRSRKPGDKSSPIGELPNEILTHALSHISPSDLSSISLVSRRFHHLVTTPHAWRTAFSRYFPGAEPLTASEYNDKEEESGDLRAERRSFTRLSALASWRSEYILRTRLLRSLGRGKPVQAIASPSSSRSGTSHTATPIIMYNSQLFTTINHLHATFGSGGLNKRQPRFIHGADDMGAASTSDPTVGKVDSWGASDPTPFLQFFERFPGDAQYGLGAGDVVGVPNVMDVSQPYGMVYGEGHPGGLIYYRSVEEQRGRFLAFSLALAEYNIPRISYTVEAMCAVWIAKSTAVPSISEGLVGIMCGSSHGVVTSYSLGTDGVREQRLGRGELTARWVLSPGVPIIAIAVDNEYSLKRQAQNRIWAVALNALGEVFYLTKCPKRGQVERGKKVNEEGLERLAWETGRSVYWNLVEPSRRVANPDPYSSSAVDGSYSPRSSWNGMCLSREQIKAETREIETFLQRRPKEFRKACEGWDMRKRLEVDFAGDDGRYAGENVVVVQCGIEEEDVAGIKRFTRCKFQENRGVSGQEEATFISDDTKGTKVGSSLFGGVGTVEGDLQTASSSESLKRQTSHSSSDGSATPKPWLEEWRTSHLTLEGLRSVQVTTTAVDTSTYALLTISEDPLLSFASNTSMTSSPLGTPLSPADTTPASSSDVPGQRARFLAAGTKMGSILLWNVRAPNAQSAEVINTISPVRIIHTDSPEISCLGLSALCLVHGGNDGLVQAWDPLASTTIPIRTLHSRFSSRARRRLVQAQASPQGVGINLFAAGAICLDPDPTVLRGMVSLGTHVRYWSYSSSTADQYKSHKRRLRRAERGSNNAGDARAPGFGRGNLKDYIANEKMELEYEKEQRRRKEERLAGRFGIDLLGENASEEELLAYAALLSEESLAQDLKRRESASSTAVGSATLDASLRSRGIATPEGRTAAVDPPSSKIAAAEEEMDPDIAEAIRLSLAEAEGSAYRPTASNTNATSSSSSTTAFGIPIRYKKSGRSSPHSPPRRSCAGAGAASSAEMTDLEFALQLSLAEEASRREVEDALAEEEIRGGEEAFPVLRAVDGGRGSVSGGAKGKGKGRMW